MFDRPVKLHTAVGEACAIRPELTGDLEDPDYNNEHYSLRWEDCAFEKDQKPTGGLSEGTALYSEGPAGEGLPHTAPFLPPLPAEPASVGTPRGSGGTKGSP